VHDPGNDHAEARGHAKHSRDHSATWPRLLLHGAAEARVGVKVALELLKHALLVW